MTRLLAAIPWDSPFMWARPYMANLNLRFPEGVEGRWAQADGWCSARRKTRAVELAREWGAEWLWLNDADHLNPPDVLERLWVHAQAGRHPISALVPSRGFVPHLMEYPFQAVCWGEDGRPFTPAKVQTVVFGQMGCILLRVDLFDRLPRPWFDERFDETTYGRRQSLDQRFTARLAREMGTPVWVDPDIPLQHMHAFPLTRGMGGGGAS